MLFVTNRSPKESARSRRGRKLTFPPQKTRASLDMYFCERLTQHEYREIGSPDFFQRLKSLPKRTQILFYLHGFNNTPEPDIFPTASQLQQLINTQCGDDFALVIPLIWPCDDDAFYAFIDDYWDDQKAADASGLAFARMLSKFDAWRLQEASSSEPCTRRINILAHSMGNRVLRNAMITWGKFDHGNQVPNLFRNIFMIAADVINSCLANDESGALISQSARNVVVYFANDDLAMPASKLSNLKNKIISARLGKTGPKDLTKVARNVFEVDCDNFNNRFDWPKGHTYFLDYQSQISPALLHMLSAMKDGRVKPAQRSYVLPFEFSKV